MKKLLVTLLLVGTFSFSQEKKTEIPLDEKINTSLDSLSKIYNKKVYSFGYVSYRGVKKTHIRYVENGKNIKKIIKTEFLNPPKKDDE
jgi:hypothetical protein